MQDPLGGIVQVVELPVPGGPEEQTRRRSPPIPVVTGSRNSRARIGRPLRTIASTRAAFQITTALEIGIRTAATSGLTSPAAAAATDSTL